MADILLVSCYELGQEPLGLVGPAGLLARAGYAVELLDLAVEDLDEERVATASLIGISAPMHTALRLGVRAARRLRALRPQAHVCFYGAYAALNRDLLGEVANSCLGAEFEADLLALAGRVVGAPPNGRPAGRQAAPLREGLRARERYVKLAHRGTQHRVGAVATTRGCKHVCRHCPLPPLYGGRFRAVAADAVLRDIGALVESGVAHVTFADPDFLNGPTHALRVARRLHEAFPRVTFDYTAKVAHLRRHRRAVEELQALGSLFVVTAVESLDDRVLAALDKGHTRADALDVFAHFRRIGLALRPSLVPFTPWETAAGYLDLLATLAGEGLVAHVDPVQYTIRLLVPPGSLLLESDAMRPHLDGLDAEHFSHRWRHPDPRMDALQPRLAEIAERAAEAGEGIEETYAAIAAAASGALGGHAAASGERPARERGSADPPRLTEAWFC
jgi:hypothetical protein